MTELENPRFCGNPAYRIALVHGGPGAVGDLAPVAQALSAPRPGLPAERGVLEPLQTATTLDGQVTELHDLLVANTNFAVTLVGHSWGAWLGWITAARYPDLVAKLVLVSSGPFEEQYAPQLQTKRLERLTPEEAAEYGAALEALSDPTAPDQTRYLERLGGLAAKADAYDPLPDEPRTPALSPETGRLYQQVWGEAAGLRRSGELLGLASQIHCPVIIIHGADDPHPAEGVRAPLEAALEEVHFVLLEHCGHKPWQERQARGAFFEALEAVL
jgi:pimeloyl-ACP methyl ester carboxylesterase